MTRTGTRPATARQWAGLALLALPTVLLGLDLTVLYLALPALSADLDPTATQTLWIMDSYGFFIAGFLLTMGTLGDRIGRRRLLVLGMAAFAAASVLAAFAPTAEALIAARALLGIAGATLMPSTLSLIATLFPEPRQRAVAIGVWATMFALGMAAGPVVGGLLVERFWWGAAFLPALPIAVIVLAGAPRLLPEYTSPGRGRLDPVSVALSLAMLLPVVYAVKHLAAHGPDVTVVLTGGVGIAAGIAFVRRQIRLDDPLLDVTLFTDRVFASASAVLLAGLVGVGGAMYLVTLYLQMIAGLSPAAAGWWMGPPALAMFAAAIGAPLLARRVRPGWVMAGTLGGSVIGYALLATAGTDSRHAVVLGFAFIYAGLGAIAALGTDMVVGAAPPAKSGSAAAVSETVQELGLAVGVAVLGSLTTALYRARVRIPEGTPPEVADRIGESIDAAVAAADRAPAAAMDSAAAAFTTGLNVSAAVAGVAIAVVAALCAVALRGIRPLGGG